ncbi:MAG: clostripain-related cysteine peptidase [Candidatus Hodarchaeales archaeon]|jgi:hypothetical protein
MVKYIRDRKYSTLTVCLFIIIACSLSINSFSFFINNTNSSRKTNDKLTFQEKYKVDNSYANKIDSSNQKNWTIMSFISADNEGEHSALDALQELEAGIIQDKGVEVVALVDRNRNYDSSNGNWSGARYYHITPDNDTRIIHSEMKMDLGEVSLGNPQVLRDFVTWTQQEYPAEKYALTYIGHGMGIGGMSYDEDSNWDYLTLDEIQQAMDGLHIDLFAIDSCAMGDVEVAYEFRTFTDYILFSEELAQKEGFDYQFFIQELAINPSIEPWEFGKIIIQSAVEPIEYPLSLTRTLINASKITHLVSVLSNFTDKLVQLTPSDFMKIADLRLNISLFEDFLVDIGTFANILKNNFTDNQEIIDASMMLHEAYNETIIDFYRGPFNEFCTGMAIYFPVHSLANARFNSYTNPTADYDFDKLDFLEDTPWAEFLIKYLQYAPVIYEEPISYQSFTLEKNYDLSFNNTDDKFYFEFSVTTKGIYNFSIDVKEGDIGIFVEDSTGNKIGSQYYLYSDAQNPDQTTKEEIIFWLDSGIYYIEIRALTTPATGDFITTAIKPLLVEIEEEITGKFPPRRGGAGSPIQTIYNYYQIDLVKGNYNIIIDISNHVLLETNIWDNDHTVLQDSFYGNEGDDYTLTLEVKSDKSLLIEFGAYEWTGSFAFKITQVSSNQLTSTSQPSTTSTLTSQSTSESQMINGLNHSIFIFSILGLSFIRRGRKTRIK